MSVLVDNQTPFTLDGVAYNMRVPEGGIRRSFQVYDKNTAGRTISGLMKRAILGTYYNYEIQIETNRASLAEYDRFYEAISDPDKDSHALVVPYGQDVLTFDAYVTSGDDTLRRMDSTGQHWEGLALQFVAMRPQRRRT